MLSCVLLERLSTLLRNLRIIRSESYAGADSLLDQLRVVLHIFLRDIFCSLILLRGIVKILPMAIHDKAVQQRVHIRQYAYYYPYGVVRLEPNAECAEEEQEYCPSAIGEHKPKVVPHVPLDKPYSELETAKQAPEQSKIQGQRKRRHIQR